MKFPNGWNVTTQDDHCGNYHVYPVNDLKDHHCENCWCKPTVDHFSPNLLVHNSMDRREEYETGKRKSH